MVAISIVSHGHGEMVTGLTVKLLECPEISRIIITKNIPEILLLPESLKIHIITNDSPKGFGANHNFAFSNVKEEYFCPLNPDIRLLNNPFPHLIDALRKCNAELVAPVVLNEFGGIEDIIRYFPTLPSLMGKFFFKTQGHYSVDNYEGIFSPEWVAGMFMLFRSSAYEGLNGFDEKYFLYYEDVDICIRLWRLGMGLIVDPSVSVIHDARRASRNNFSHMKLHLKSMSIYLFRYLGRLPSIKPYHKHV